MDQAFAKFALSQHGKHHDRIAIAQAWYALSKEERAAYRSRKRSRDEVKVQKESPKQVTCKCICNDWGTFVVPLSWEFDVRQESYRVCQKYVAPESDESRTIQSLFYLTCPDYQIKSIRRVQNLRLWTSFWNTLTWATRGPTVKLDPQFSAGSPGEVHVLFHGTSFDSISSICTNGFNRSLPGQSQLGRGTHFATDASASADHSPKHIESGYRYMLACHVMTGHVTRGRPEYHVLPTLRPETLEYHDSTTDRLEKPRVYAIFQDHQAYPTYVIEFSEAKT
jgi:hypothetical protein